MKLNLLDTVLRSSVRFVLPQDCPDYVIDYHYLVLRGNIIKGVKKTSSTLKKIFNR